MVGMANNPVERDGTTYPLFTRQEKLPKLFMPQNSSKARSRTVFDIKQVLDEKSENSLVHRGVRPLSTTAILN
jgi:hypothetical protein